MMKSFTDANVPLENIVGFASDGCNTMMGKNNSVSSRLHLLLIASLCKLGLQAASPHV